MVFKPGKSGNPSGKKPIPEYLRKYGKLVREEVMHIIARFANMDADELKQLTNVGSGVSGLERSIILNILDKDKLAFLLDRTIGKVTEVVEQTNTYASIETPKLIELGEAAIKVLKEEDK